MRSKLQVLFSVAAVVAMLLNTVAPAAASWATPPVEPAQPILNVSAPIENVSFAETVAPATVADDAVSNGVETLISSQAVTPTSDIRLKPVLNIDTGGEGTAEIISHEPNAQKLFVTNGENDRVDVWDIGSPSLDGSIDVTSVSNAFGPGSGVNSVATYDYGSFSWTAVAIEVEVEVGGDENQMPGIVAVYTDTMITNPAFTFTTGALPDMVTFTPDGNKILTANEGEPGDTMDPEGSVTIADISGLLMGTMTMPVVSTASFTPLNNASFAPSVRIFGEGNPTVAQDLEPEYIAVSTNSITAYVTLQENNALAIVDLTSSTVVTVAGLGFKNYGMAGNAIDASDRDDPADDTRDDQQYGQVTEVDGTINIRTWDNVFGMYQPDAIAYKMIGGQGYLFTANEGDARGFEEARVTDLSLDTSVFSEADISSDAKLGRLEISTVVTDTNNDDLADVLYSFGARSFTVWNADTGANVWDSGDQFEQITAAFDPSRFNSNNGIGEGNSTFDSRSDAKGPEPEAIDVGEYNGRYYAFIGLERVGGIMVYDVTDPMNPQFVQYINTWYMYGDLAPEGVKFVEGADSPLPSDNPVLLVAFEGSGSVTVFEIVSGTDHSGTLTLLHNNDGESALEPDGIEGGVAAFKSVLDREVDSARESGNSVLNVYAGDSFLASAALQCVFPITDTSTPVYDALAQRAMNYDAHALGNHEFDYTPTFLKRFIDDYTINKVNTQPFMASNLDFTPDTNYADLIVPENSAVGNNRVFGVSYSTDGRVVAESSIVIDKATGQRFGIVTAITPRLENISSPDPVVVETDTVTATVAVIQDQVDALDAYGIKNIILVSHLQNLEIDTQQVIPALRNVDISVGGGGDELLTNKAISETLQLLPSLDADDISGDYPTTAQDLDGNTVYAVTGIGNYNYVGRLDVTFDANGNVTGFDNSLSYPRRVIEDADQSTYSDGVAPDPNVKATAVDPLTACFDEFRAEEIATIEDGLELQVSRAAVRGGESNAGNLIADSFRYIYSKYASDNNLPALTSTIIALQNGGGIRDNAGDILTGTLSYFDTVQVLAFTTNSISVVPDVSPSELKEILEWAVSGLPSNEGRFLQVSGIVVTYDISGTTITVDNPENPSAVITDGNRIQSITLSDGTKIVENGAVVSGAPNVTIVTNSFTAGGGDGYFWFANNTNQSTLFDSLGGFISYDQAWREYLQDTSGLNGTVSAAQYPAGVDSRIIEAQDEDDVAPTSVEIDGPMTGVVGTAYDFTATVTPTDTTTPVTYTWTVADQSNVTVSGGITNAQSYTWTTSGQKTLMVTATNGISNPVMATKVITIASADLAITKTAPITALAGEAILYTLTVSNNSSVEATNLTITDEVPAGARHIDGGMLVGNVVSWTVASLAANATVEVTFTVESPETITNTTYGVTADGGLSATGLANIVTTIEDNTGLDARPGEGRELVGRDDRGNRVRFNVPAGAVGVNTIFRYTDTATPTQTLSDTLRLAAGFFLQAFRGGVEVENFQFVTGVTITITYTDTAIAEIPNEESLILYIWNGTAWVDAATTCTPPSTYVRDTDGNTISVRVCHLTEFVLAGSAGTDVYLPVIQRNDAN